MCPAQELVPRATELPIAHVPRYGDLEDLRRLMCCTMHLRSRQPADVVVDTQVRCQGVDDVDARRCTPRLRRLGDVAIGAP